MTFLQALRYFIREALVSLRRSARVSTLAVLTIAVSLLLAGVLLLVSRNAAESVAAWREEARFVVFLDHGADAPALAAELVRAPWVTGAEVIDPVEARRRFERSFPSLSALVAEGGEGQLPTSIEARLAAAAAGPRSAEFRAWVEQLRQRPGVEAVDDDRDWIEQVERTLAFVRALGWTLSAVLLGASIFTIASVVRFTALLYREEIAIMRLVGATEFYIRGPFYLEGVLQGLIGAALALAALFAAYSGLRPRIAESLIAEAVAARFLSPAEIALLLAFGALAGLVGSVVSLGREGLPDEGRPR